MNSVLAFGGYTMAPVWCPTMRTVAPIAMVYGMSEFNRHYIVLSLFVIGGVGGTAYGARGGDPEIGAFSSGITIGVFLAFYMLRTAELRFFRSNGRAQPLQHEDADRASTLQRRPLDPGVEAGKHVPPDQARNVVQHPWSNAKQVQEPAGGGTGGDLDDEHELGPFGAVSRCSCVCGCSRRSLTGESDLCGNCYRWWVNQSKKCTCDYSVEEYCVCGEIKHGAAA